MATLSAQIQALAGTGTGSEMADWMTDGAREIINILPTELKEKCSQITALTDGNGVDMDGFGDVLHVTRETGNTTTIYAPCRKIPSMYGGMAADSSSLMYYGTATDPVYWIESNSSDHSKLFIKPDPTASQDAKIYHIGYPLFTTGDTETWDIAQKTTITNFPDEAEYLVVLYAAIKVLQNKMNEKSGDLPSDISDIALNVVSTSLPSYTAPNDFVLPPSPSGANVSFSEVGSVETFVAPIFSAPSLSTISSITLPVIPTPPVAPSFTNISGSTIGDVTVSSTSVSNVGTPPTYTAPTVGGTADELTDITQLDGENTIDDFDGNAIEIDQWFATVAHLIEDEEDIELASAQLQKIQTYVGAYQAQMQNNLHTFNKENAAYQAKLQESIQQAQINAQKAQKDADLSRQDAIQTANLTLQEENQEYAAKLQKYSSELQAYQGQVNAEIQKWNSDTFGKPYKEWIQKYQGQLQEYGTDVQKETVRVQASLADYQAKVNKALQTYQAETGYDMRKYQADIQANVQKFNSDLSKASADFTRNLQKYSAEVQKVSQDNQSSLAKNAQNIQNYNAKIQKHSVDYQWYQRQQVKLQQDYNQGIQLLIGGGRPPQQQRGER